MPSRGHHHSDGQNFAIEVQPGNPAKEAPPEAFLLFFGDCERLSLLFFDRAQSIGDFVARKGFCVPF